MNHDGLPRAAFAYLGLRLALVLASGGLASADDPSGPKTTPATIDFKGTWVNRKMRSSGPLTCRLEPNDQGDWSGRFAGTFKGDPFKYDVTFSATSTATKTDLKGKARLDGDLYDWTGTLKGDTLTIRYRSLKGYNGDFTLKRTVKADEIDKPTPRPKRPRSK